jgi:subtilisin family serine protease
MEEPLRVIIELRHTTDLESFAARAAEAEAEAERPTLEPQLVPELPGLAVDESFPPVLLPGRTEQPPPTDPKDISAVRFDIDPDPAHGTYIVRGTIADESKLSALEKAGRTSRAVVGVYSDVLIEPSRICGGDPPMGNDQGVERLLCAERLRECGMDGTGVLVAVVDTGINMDYLRSRGKIPGFDQFRSWVPVPGLVPGQLPVDHGTMVAFDVTIAAPRCTLLDIALLQSRRPGRTIMEGVLSDAILAYSHLINIIAGDRLPGELNALVVNNSWGMFHPSWDFPVGNPGNYSDNINHPFNRIVATLERAGADILFAAGNCGADCPDRRCRGVTNMAIYGANSHPQVLSVAGVDVSKDRVGYSAIGPGRLDRMKPDISGYTHFRGSGVYAADGGTSAASPVVAGVVAAVRTKMPYNPGAPATAPAAMRALINGTAEDRAPVGYDFEYGWGIVNGCRLADLFCERKEPEPKKPKRIRCRVVRCRDVKCRDDHDAGCDCLCGHDHGREIELEVECDCDKVKDHGKGNDDDSPDWRRADAE